MMSRCLLGCVGVFISLEGLALAEEAPTATSSVPAPTEARPSAVSLEAREEVPPPVEAPASEPFAWGDFTWLQGSTRQRASLLDGKYFTGIFTCDVNYNYSSNRPRDHTNVGSTATFREGEVNLSFIAFGGDFHWNGARGRLLLQLGTRATGVPRNDLTPLRGQFDLYTALRYISEAYGGYHFDVLHGINVDVGMFMSYVGLLSFNNFENWNYQPSYTSDNTPWFFTGVRIQIFPTDNLKIEPWLINGWQTYGMFNEAPGVGYQILYRPLEWLSALLNGYVGFDTPAAPTRVRFHSDNSILVRYYNNPDGFITKAAFSLTGDVGFESGAGVKPFGTDDPGPGGDKVQNFISWMGYHRVWFLRDLFGWTFGGGHMSNPGRYLVLYPTGAANPLLPSSPFTANPGDVFNAWDMSTNIQFMPNDYLTWGVEVVYRHASVPYFAGRGGVTSPNGYNPPVGDPTNFVPDLVKSETRLILSMLLRM
jgi:hypothetical protein